MIKLFVDDMRDPPDNTWVVARSYWEAVDFISLYHPIDTISLDHDLGIDSDGNELTGYDLICYIEANDMWPNTCIVHSSNPAGRLKMQLAIDRHHGRP
jgi:hypothetical protein